MRVLQETSAEKIAESVVLSIESEDGRIWHA